MAISKHSICTAIADVLIPSTVGHWLTTALRRAGTASSRSARRPSMLARHRPAAQHRATVPAQHRATRRYQALLDLPAPAGISDGVPWPTWRAVVRARHHQTNGDGLFSALVSCPEGAASPTCSYEIVTMVVVGDSPADYLGIGDEFDLWRGADVAHGVITRRLFV